MMISPEKFEELMRGPNISEAPKPITNYEKLFGTSERAARTLRGKCCFCALEKAVCIGNECDEGILNYLNKEATI